MGLEKQLSKHADLRSDSRPNIKASTAAYAVTLVLGKGDMQIHRACRQSLQISELQIQ